MNIQWPTLPLTGDAMSCYTTIQEMVIAAILSYAPNFDPNGICPTGCFIFRLDPQNRNRIQAAVLLVPPKQADSDNEEIYNEFHTITSTILDDSTVFGYCVFSEAWITSRLASSPEPLTLPSKSPDRKEALVVSGVFYLDSAFYTLMGANPIERDASDPTRANTTDWELHLSLTPYSDLPTGNLTLDHDRLTSLSNDLFPTPTTV